MPREDLDLTENLNNSFGFARRLFSDLGRLLILIVLTVIPIVNFIVVGYAGRVVKDSPGTDGPPKLEGYGQMWVQGLKIVVATLIYTAVPGILFSLGLLTFFVGQVGFNALDIAGSMSAALLGVGAIFFMLGIIVAFALLIFGAVGIIHMIRHDQFGKAFAIGEILRIIRGIGWGGYIVWLAVIFIISLIIGAIGSIPFIGWLISLIISPAYIVFVARSAGLMYAEGGSKTGGG